MELAGAVISTILLAVTLVIGGLCFFKGIYFIFKASSNRNEDVANQSSFVKFNFFNSLWVPKGLNEKGKIYRRKAAKNMFVFFGLLLLTAAVSSHFGV